MRKPLPDPQSLKKAIKSSRRLLEAEKSDRLPFEFVQQVTDLVYSGHEKKAFEFIEKAWPLRRSGKKKFLDDYREALSESLYYSQFADKFN